MAPRTKKRGAGLHPCRAFNPDYRGVKEIKHVIDKENIEKLKIVWPRLRIEEKKEVLKLLNAAENFEKTHATLCYEPHPKQKLFHCAENWGRAIFGGNQSGKTYAGTMEDAMHFTMEYPQWYPEERRMKGTNVGRIMVKDFPHGVGEIIEPALMRCIHPRHIHSIKRNAQGFLQKMVGKNGNRLDIITHDMDTMACEGWQGDWLHCDEPPPRDKWVASLRGLIRRQGRWWITCTPLQEPYIYDEIYTKPGVFNITVDIRDNPHLKEEEIKKFEESLTEDEKEARLHGKFMHLSGLVYKEFEPNVHIKAPIQIPSDWPRYRIVDPHDRKPFACAWFAVDPMDRIWWYKEWPLEDFHRLKTSRFSPKDYVHLWREMEMGETIYRRIMDARFGRSPQLSMKGSTSGEQDTLFDIFDDLGEYFEPSYITTSLGVTDPGHQKVKEMLRVSPVTNEPSMFVFSTCKNLIYAFQHNTWEESKDTTLPAKEKQSQYAKDFLDLVRYGLMDNPRYIPQEPSGVIRSTWARKQQNSGTYGSDAL